MMDKVGGLSMHFYYYYLLLLFIYLEFTLYQQIKQVKVSRLCRTES